IRAGSTSLPPKTALWNTTRGRLGIDEVNALARSFRPQVMEPPYRFLDDEWLKTHHTDERADALYRLTQAGSRTLEGRGAGLLRAHLPEPKG
ncbi:MAG TPA: hypothetical protein VGP90_09840, partial [Acidimicrobiia bacterium]|nr:hypothetical protein [Acidimicrobiia bacterium]